MMDRETVRGWLPAYALGALDEDERRQVEALLAEDELAGQALRDYTQIAQSLLYGVPAVAPPPDLEHRLMARSRRNAGRMVVWPVLAAVAVLALVVATVFLTQRLASPSAEALYQQVVAAPDHVAVALVPALSPDITGQLVYRPGEPTAIIRVSNLPALNADQAYQLWLVDESGSVSGGVYRPDESTVYIRVPATRPIAEYARFGVSLEPADGSPLGNRASGPRVFSIPIQT
jgi:anti-sigma-K factor RskA